MSGTLAGSAPSAPHEPPSLPPAPTLLDRTFLTNVAGVTEIILVRHGMQERGTTRTRVDREQPDPRLSTTGCRQAELVGKRLAREPLEAVYCSTLRRAIETARAVAAHHDVDAVVCEELREVELFRDVPEGQAIADVISRVVLRGANRRFVEEQRWDTFPLSETGAELRHRVANVVEGILASHPGKRVAIVCHGGVVNAYLVQVLGLDADMFCHPAHASVSRVLAKDGRRVVHTVNETHHLCTSSDEDLVTY